MGGATQKSGFYHHGRFTTLAEVVDHYESCFRIGLAAQEKQDIVEYLKSQSESK